MRVSEAISGPQALGVAVGQRFMVGKNSQFLHFGPDGRIYTEDGMPIRAGLQDAIVRADDIVVPTNYVGGQWK